MKHKTWDFTKRYNADMSVHTYMCMFRGKKAEKRPHYVCMYKYL